MKTEEKKMTGYPSIDKPWLKYYSEEVINVPLPECNLYQYMYDNNKDNLNGVAINYFGRKITYGQLLKKIEMIAKSFKSLGICKGDIVTIMSMHTPETIYSIYALNRIGAIANMVYMTLSEEELVSVVKKTNSKALLVLDTNLDKVLNSKEELNNIDIIVLYPEDSMPLKLKIGYRLKNKKPKRTLVSFKKFASRTTDEVFVDEAYEKDTPAVIVYTSGTTGEPKGVVLSNDNLNAVAYQYKLSGVKFEQGDMFFDMLPPYLGFGICVGMNVPLALGLETVLWILPDPIKVAEAYIKYKPNHFVSAPIVIEEIQKRLGENLSYIKTFSVGGESPTLESVNQLNDIFKKGGTDAKYITGYGMTETGATVCTQLNHIFKIGSLGVPMICTNIKIVDTETEEELKYNKVGEMWFSSPSIMKQYYENQKATNDIISIDEDGIAWIHTGDLGMIDEEGFVYHKGRLKRIYMTMVKGGEVYKLFPALVEETFNKNSKVKTCGTVAIPNDERINVLVAYIAKKNTSDSDEEVINELMDLAKEELPEHSVPVDIVVIDNMPVTASGKIDYRTLEKKVVKTNNENIKN